MTTMLMQLSRLQLYGLGSTVVFFYTVIHAFRQRSNFYAAAVYLSHSNACVMILWNQAIYQFVLLGKLLQKIFFGPLRLIEVERLQERAWFAITETLLALTIFKDEFESSFVILFVSLLFLKLISIKTLAQMEQSAQVSRLAHIRMISLLALLWVADVVLLISSVECILIEGPTVMIMFASEYMILIANVWTVTMKYILNCIDLRSQVPWEEKSIYGLYVDLTADFFKLLTYLTFFSLILTFYGLPLNILRDVYMTLRSFVLKIRDLRRYRRATSNMDTLYPNATLEEMEQMSDKTCIICREDMEFRGPIAAPTDGAAVPVEPVPPPTQRQGPNDTPKKLPCGHVFHFHCLRSWLERQQSCPTCRRTVLTPAEPRNEGNNAGRRANAGGRGAVPAVAAASAGAAAAAAPVPNGEEAIRQAQINLARSLGREAFAVVFPDVPFPPEAFQAPETAPQAAGASGASATAGSSRGASGATTSTIGETRSSLLPPPGRVGSSPPLSPDLASGNPLARFGSGLGSTPLGASSALNQAPMTTFPSFELGGAGTGSGLYSGLGIGGPLPTRGPGAPSTLEARLQYIRRKIHEASEPAAPTASTSAEGPSTHSEAMLEVQEEQGQEEEKEMTAREAALAAAERRATQAGKGTKTMGKRSDVVGDKTSTNAETPLLTLTPSSVPPSTPPRSGSSHPRLIPLFDASAPRRPFSTTYPHLAASSSDDSLLPSAPTSEQLAELSHLTRATIEARLKLLLRWQVKVEGLVDEMRAVLDAIPSETLDSDSKGSRASGEASEEVTREDKGKQPTEGMHAAVR
ncbi:BQ2448_4635 [Microbotryum intermedium]|uniref:RING-type E3 ubiquitin transferase n=1 Tax=Microbotryum intermedium TaxID=269621 RepID=A0A238FIH0_9BASI|nr:BQ2448_4635 [Microbotryum intermedium]